jgi:hypothetical protein
MVAACPKQLLDMSDQVAQALWQVSVYKSSKLNLTSVGRGISELMEELVELCLPGGGDDVGERLSAMGLHVLFPLVQFILLEPSLPGAEEAMSLFHGHSSFHVMEMTWSTEEEQMEAFQTLQRPMIELALTLLQTRPKLAPQVAPAPHCLPQKTKQKKHT